MQGSRDRNAVRGCRGIQGAATTRLRWPAAALQTHQAATSWHRWLFPFPTTASLSRDPSFRRCAEHIVLTEDCIDIEELHISVTAEVVRRLVSSPSVRQPGVNHPGLPKWRTCKIDWDQWNSSCSLLLCNPAFLWSRQTILRH